MDLRLFENKEFGEIRVTDICDKPYVVGVDVANALGYKNPRDAILRHCKGVVKHDSFKAGGNMVALITEGDVYRLVANSKLPSAEKFESWIFDEVLPTIRKHGAYMTEETIEKALSDPDTLIKLATTIKEERAKRQLAEAEIEKNKPKVLFADAIETSRSSILVGELAKLLKQNGIEIGQNRLFDWMRENGYLIKQKGESYNLPTQYSMDLHLFEIKKSIINNPDGTSRVNRTPKVTGKGQIYFVNKFKKMN